MKWRQAFLAVLLATLVVGSGFAGATALGAPAPAADQHPASVEQTVTHPTSVNVTDSENESNSSGPPVGEDWAPPEEKGSSNVSSQLRRQLDTNQSDTKVGTDSVGGDGPRRLSRSSSKHRRGRATEPATSSPGQAVT